MQLEIETKVSAHELKRIVNSSLHESDTACLVGAGIHLEHLSKCGIGIGTRAVAELLALHRNMVIERNQFHVIVKKVHHFFQLKRVFQRKSEQDKITILLGFLHGVHIQ